MNDDIRQGQPGEPGRPGEPGVGGGGAGGTGGHGGRGGRAVEHHRMSVLLAFVVVVAIGLSTATFIFIAQVSDNTEKIRVLQQQNATQFRRENAIQDQAIVHARQAEYRLCVRQIYTRVALLLHASRDGDAAAPIRGLPLLDCTPNLVGLPAVPLTSIQRGRLLRRARSGKGLI